MNTASHKCASVAFSVPLKQTCFVLFLLTAMLAGGCSSPQHTEIDLENRQFSFWPQFPSEPHVQFLVAYRLTSDIETKKSKLDDIIYGKDTGTLPITKPYGVEMRDGKIYVCDIKNPNLIVLDLVKKQTRMMTTSGLGGMSQPTDVAISSDGMIYVADAKKGVIFVFDANEKHIKSFGHKGFKPVAVAVYKNEIYVSDHATQSVLVMDRFDGSKLRVIGGPGADDGLFIRPQGIDVDSDGNVYVSDVIKCRLQIFNSQGELVLAVGRTGDTAGSFVRPKHLALDSNGIVYVADAAFDNVQMFNDEGQVLMFFGSGGEHPGAMNLPAGVGISESKSDIELFREYIHPAFEVENLVLVTNQFGSNKVEIFAVGQLREGMTVDDISKNISVMGSGVKETEDEVNPLTGDLQETNDSPSIDGDKLEESNSP